MLYKLFLAKDLSSLDGPIGLQRSRALLRQDGARVRRRTPPWGERGVFVPSNRGRGILPDGRPGHAGSAKQVKS